MSFVDERLPVTISYNSSVNVRTLSSVVETPGGKRKTSKIWTMPRWEMDISYLIQSQTEYDAIRNFHAFVACGSVNSFRVKDWSDYSMTDEEQDSPVSLEIQITKEYSFNSTSYYTRYITKPVNGTLIVKDNGVTLTEGGGSDYTCDYSTGVITLAGAPTEPVTVTCEFDVHAYFEGDTLPATFSYYNIYDFEPIMIMEVKEGDQR